MRTVELSKLEKASKMVGTIKKIDDQIIKLDKLAGIVATKKSKQKISINVTDLEKEEKVDYLAEEKNDYDSLPIFSFFHDAKPSTPINDDSIKLNLDDSTMLRLLSVTIKDLQKKREDIIASINGINIYQ